VWLEAGLARLVDEFWELAGAPGPFPRDLSMPASLALPVAVAYLPRLSLDNLTRWLRDRNIVYDPSGPDRRLRGCLVAYGGHGFVLIDSADPADEQRFTLAHELAHFLIDYREPHSRVIHALGEEILPVLDGLRQPTRAERLHAVLSAVPLGLHVDLMERTDAGGYISPATLAAEGRADRLALELLAPAGEAWVAIAALPEADKSSCSYTELRNQAGCLLCERYGLPGPQAQSYAKWLLKKGGYSPGFRDWLGEDF
jgi:hypothetical protein